MTGATPGWERNVIKPDHRFPRHAHMGWSVAVVLAGAGFFRTAGSLHEAWPGAITVLHPGEPHQSWAHPHNGLDYLVVTVAEETAARWYPCRGTPTFAQRVIDDPGCAIALRAACRQRDRGSQSPGIRPGGAILATALAQLFQRHARGGRAPAHHSPVIRTMREYLDEHYAAPLSLRDMASLVHTSPATLVRRFSAELGMPPHEYLVSRRIDAARALAGTDRSLREIAQLTGFADQSHLHRHFTRIVGVTPGRFHRHIAPPSPRER